MSSVTSPWYALQVKANREWAVMASLMNRGVEASCPAYREARQWSDRIKIIDVPLFRGYVFARFDASNPLLVVTSPGVARIVSLGGTPAPVDDGEMNAIHAIAQSDVVRSPIDYVEVGQKVTITHGPLRGVRGILARVKNADRFIVSVSLLQRSVMVEVPANCIRQDSGEYCWAASSTGLCA